MKRTFKRKTAVISFGCSFLMILVSLTTVVGYQAAQEGMKASSSPLFHLRLDTIINQDATALSTGYLGKDKACDIPLPTREIVTDALLDQLSTEEVKEKVRSLDNTLGETWEVLLSVARGNLASINCAIRQEYLDYQTQVSEFYDMSLQDVHAHFLELVSSLDIGMLATGTTTPHVSDQRGNLTTGPICNITSGQICQITTQPICLITTQPICFITKGVLCWTIIGPICPTTGLKCHTPTARPLLCSIIAASGKILKTLILVLLLAIVIFVPLAILSLVLITVFNPERCEQIRGRITTWFNCTSPEPGWVQS